MICLKHRESTIERIRKMNKKQTEKLPIWLVLFSFIKLSFQAYWPYFGIAAFKSMILTMQTLYHTAIVSILIASLEKRNLRLCILVGICLTGIHMFFSSISKWSICFIKVHQAKLQEKINHKIFEKMTKIPYQYLEDTECLDLIERAKFAITNENCLDVILTTFTNILQSILTLFGLITVILLFDIKLIFILLIAALLNIFLFGTFSKTRLEFSNWNLDINRKFVYYTNTLFDSKNGKDFRTYPIGSFLRKKFNWFAEKMVIYYNRYLKKSDQIKIGMQLIKYIEIIMVYGCIIEKTIRENFSISYFTFYTSTAMRFSATITSFINDCMKFYVSLRLAVPLIELMNIQEETNYGKGILLEQEIKTLKFEHVTFSYPKSSSTVLKDISFEIHVGEKISIVGLNGAGKTTLIKLLCRLYRPDKGDILLNDISIYDYDYFSYQNRISTIFQDFKLFAYSLKDNITNDGTKEQAYHFACKVGLKKRIDSLPDGIQTLYTKTFDETGIEFSGGESQKVALARAFCKKASLILLDEPTSAFDPLAEAKFYQQFNQLGKNKTVIYISHRMSSSIFCDKILLIENGRVVDYDTHTNLIQKKESMYYKLFMEQANRYKISEI